MKKLRRLLIAVIVLLIVTELVARFVLGLGELPVYIKSGSFEYIYAPGQDVKRFGNRIVTNDQSMRSKPLSTKDKVRILKIGDSVINGGSQTDHDSLASTILENDLSLEFNDSIRVLNAGANSWGPDNAFAYLREKDLQGLSMLVLVFSSHDLYDNMHHKEVVGVHPAWPDEQPLCATTDGLFKYAVPWLRKKLDSSYDEYAYLGMDRQQDKINPGWDSLFGYARKNNLQLLVYLHAEKSEVQKGSYNNNGLRLINMLDSAGVEYIKGIEHIDNAVYFRDFIHLNEKGQRRLAEALKPYLQQHVNDRLKKVSHRKID